MLLRVSGQELLTQVGEQEPLVGKPPDVPLPPDQAAGAFQGFQQGGDGGVPGEHFRQRLVKGLEQGQFGQQFSRLGVQGPQGGFVYVRAHLSPHGVDGCLVKGLPGGKKLKEEIHRHRASAGLIPEPPEIVGGKGEIPVLGKLRQTLHIQRQMAAVQLEQRAGSLVKSEVSRQRPPGKQDEPLSPRGLPQKLSKLLLRLGRQLLEVIQEDYPLL